MVMRSTADSSAVLSVWSQSDIEARIVNKEAAQRD